VGDGKQRSVLVILEAEQSITGRDKLGLPPAKVTLGCCLESSTPGAEVALDRHTPAASRGHRLVAIPIAGLRFPEGESDRRRESRFPRAREVRHLGRRDARREVKAGPGLVVGLRMTGLRPLAAVRSPRPPKRSTGSSIELVDLGASRAARDRLPASRPGACRSRQRLPHLRRFHAPRCVGSRRRDRGHREVLARGPLELPRTPPACAGVRRGRARRVRRTGP
jgi:hypothetical protein